MGGLSVGLTTLTPILSLENSYDVNNGFISNRNLEFIFLCGTNCSIPHLHTASLSQGHGADRPRFPQPNCGTKSESKYINYSGREITTHYYFQFEWAWQNPGHSRRLSKDLARKKRTESHFQYRFRVLTEMLRVGPWWRLPLTIRLGRLAFSQR